MKKTRLAEYDSPRSGGLIAVNLRDDDVLVGAGLAAPEDDLLLVSRQGSVGALPRRRPTSCGPMGRATSGVTGMRFTRRRPCCWRCRWSTPETEPDVFVVFENGLGQADPGRRSGSRPRAVVASRRGQVAKLSDKGGDLVGALTVTADRRGHGRHGDGARSCARQSRRGAATRAGSTMGVKFATPDAGTTRSSPLRATPNQASRMTMA
ncbi:MAG: DNA gyrase C-terminal beta-propeller domain-containing protein [Dermatophilaceae bacterium]